MTKDVTLVLLPGLDGTGKLFAPLLSEIPGFTTPIVVAYPVDRLLSLDELCPVIESQLPDAKFVLLAESFSGLPALRLLPRIRERLLGVIFVGAFAESPRPILLRLLRLVPWLIQPAAHLPNWVIRAFCLGRGASDTECRRLREVVGGVPWRVIAHRLSLISQARAPNPPTCPCPCFYVQAEFDRLVPKNARLWFERNLPGLRTFSVEAPHFMLQAKPRECAGIMEQILQILPQ